MVDVIDRRLYRSLVSQGVNSDTAFDAATRTMTSSEYKQLKADERRLSTGEPPAALAWSGPASGPQENLDVSSYATAVARSIANRLTLIVLGMLVLTTQVIPPGTVYRLIADWIGHATR